MALRLPPWLPAGYSVARALDVEPQEAGIERRMVERQRLARKRPGGGEQLGGLDGQEAGGWRLAAVSSAGLLSRWRSAAGQRTAGGVCELSGCARLLQSVRMGRSVSSEPPSKWARIPHSLTDGKTVCSTYLFLLISRRCL